MKLAERHSDRANCPDMAPDGIEPPARLQRVYTPQRVETASKYKNLIAASFPSLACISIIFFCTLLSFVSASALSPIMIKPCLFVISFLLSQGTAQPGGCFSVLCIYPGLEPAAAALQGRNVSAVHHSG